MNIVKSLSILLAISASAACGKPNGYQGAPDAPTAADGPGPIWMDALSTVYEDAQVYNDAPIARACANVSQVIAPDGVQTLTMTFTCLSPDDAGAANITLFGYSEQNGPYGVNFAGSVACGVNSYVAPNIPVNVSVARIQNDTFDLACN